jgi:hypothetical protein
MRTHYTEQLIQRAERDDEFRARLLSDPRGAITEQLGVELPDTLNLKVIEENPNEVILVLPAKSQSGALRDEELAGVAGGSGSWCGNSPCECSKSPGGTGG